MLCPLYYDSKSLFICGYCFKLATKPCFFFIYVLSSSHSSQGHSIVYLCPATPSYLLLVKSANVSVQFSSFQFSSSLVSDSLRPHESQHTRPPCPSPSPGVHSDSRPSSPWCHPAISSSVVPFSSCPQSLPASESFPMGQLFPWGVQSTGASAVTQLSRNFFIVNTMKDTTKHTQKETLREEKEEEEKDNTIYFRQRCK